MGKARELAISAHNIVLDRTDLNNTLISTSTTEALTAAQGKALQDSKVTGNVAITAGTATKITYDAKGLVTAGTTLAATDIPNLDVDKLTTGTLPVVRGGTGTTTSTGTGSTVLSASPSLTGTPTAPTAAVGTNTTQLATTAYTTATVDSASNIRDLENFLDFNF